MPADALATSGARASAGMVLTLQNENIPSPASEELTSQNIYYVNIYVYRRSLDTFY